MSDWNSNISEAPYGLTLEVTNDQMDKPIRATRGWVRNDGTVHADQGFFTSVFTPDKYFPDPAGKLVLPNKWRLLS